MLVLVTGQIQRHIAESYANFQAGRSYAYHIGEFFLIHYSLFFSQPLILTYPRMEMGWMLMVASYIAPRWENSWQTPPSRFWVEMDTLEIMWLKGF